MLAHLICSADQRLIQQSRGQILDNHASGADSGANSDASSGKNRKQRLALLALIAFSVVVLAIWQPVSLPQLLTWGEWLANEPLALFGLVVLQILLFSLAMPGTLIVWLIAPFHPPVVAVPILLVGCIGGAIGGYYVSSTLGRDWRPKRGAWLITLLTERSDFFTQTALRVLPGCPHWAVNYGSGMLGLPLPTFLLAAVLGLTVKLSLYSWVIYSTTNTTSVGDGIGLESLWPLLVLAILMLIGSYARQKLQASN